MTNSFSRKQHYEYAEVHIMDWSSHSGRYKFRLLANCFSRDAIDFITWLNVYNYLREGLYSEIL